MDTFDTMEESLSIIKMAERDSLTGVYSQTFFYHYAEREIHEHPYSDYDIIITNIEGFRLINEREGWKTGNMVLCHVASFFKGIIKDGELCGRLMADRFALLVKRRPVSEYPSMFMPVTNYLRDNDIAPVTMKYGIFQVEDRDEAVDFMCDKAATALKKIYKSYDKNFALYDEKLKSQAETEQLISDNMESAIAHHEFEVYYQPKHSIKNDNTGGAEALVRWNSPTLGFISPGQFIPIFEQNGFISKLDEYVWEEVAKSLHETLEKGIQPIPISVNISRIDFERRDLADHIIKLVDSYEVPHEYLHLEITESAYSDNPKKIAQDIETLHHAGFVIELDDFGTGYSTLSALSEISFDILKLDMSLVKGMEQPKKKMILSHVIDMASSIEIQTVAEGCETEDQAQELKKLGATYIQGFYYSKPLPENQFEQYLVANG